MPNESLAVPQPHQATTTFNFVPIWAQTSAASNALLQRLRNPREVFRESGIALGYSDGARWGVARQHAAIETLCREGRGLLAWNATLSDVRRWERQQSIADSDAYHSRKEAFFAR